MKIQIYIYDENKPEGFYKKAIAEYQKRLGRYCNISYQIMRKEKQWEKLQAKNQDGYYVLPGKSLSSEQLSKEISAWELSGQKEINFYIVPENMITTDAPEIFSISEYTINPQMLGLILYEQIYRGYRILNHHPYHK